MDKKYTCPYSKHCGGCLYTGMDYKKQLNKKQDYVRELLGSRLPLEDICGMENPLYYRNKVTAVFGYNKGKIYAGTYEKNSHNIVDIDKCLIEDRDASRVIASIKELCHSFKIKIYNEDTGYGLLRYVLIRKSNFTKKLLVVLVTASPIFPKKNDFVKALTTMHPNIETVVQDINDRTDSLILSGKQKLLFGRGYIEDKLCKLTFRVSASSFFQVNPVMTERLYNKALEYAALNGSELVLDAYCGVGTIGLIASKMAGQVIGVELNKDAIRDAITGAKNNKIKNISFYAADATVWMDSYIKNGGASFDVVFMDPPRAGSTISFIKGVARLSPSRIVYISCNPITLARDVKEFKKYGYNIIKAKAFDCFPFTEHTEVCCLLTKASDSEA